MNYQTKLKWENSEISHSYRVVIVPSYQPIFQWHILYIIVNFVVVVTPKLYAKKQEKCNLENNIVIHHLIPLTHICFQFIGSLNIFRCLNNISQNVIAIFEGTSEESSLKIMYYISYIKKNSKVRIWYCCRIWKLAKYSTNNSKLWFPFYVQLLCQRNNFIHKLWVL